MDNQTPHELPEPHLLAKSSFAVLLDVLKKRHFKILGPVVQDGAIKWDEIHRIEDLPVGWRDHQEPGAYRLEKTDARNVFDIVHGPDSVKRQTFAPREHLLTIERKKKGFTVESITPHQNKTALIGVRPCDLAGLKIQDRIFLHEQFPDPYYRVRRENLFLVAVNCTRAHATCFCASMGTGPEAQSEYDLVLTESENDFLVQAGTSEGLLIFRALQLSPASPDRVQKDDNRIAACASSQTRKTNHAQLPRDLYEAHDHPQWDRVANRCLACTNCTMVCPTCFCHAVEETPDLNRQTTERVRAWDSCFTQNHGYIHGKNFRPTIKDRYRMWLTHKVASWIDQFGASGCVGCGRCITWCPVGIDLTEELHALLHQRKEAET